MLGLKSNKFRSLLDGFGEFQQNQIQPFEFYGGKNQDEPNVRQVQLRSLNVTLRNT